MKKVTITELKSNLSNLLAQAKRGEEIIVLDRTSPIVRIVALFEFGESSELDKTAERIAKLEADGLASRRKANTMQSFLKRKRPKSKQSVMDALLDDRDDRL